MEIKRMIVGVVDTNCYLAYDKNRTGVLVDPGDSALTILNKLKEENVQLMAILLTHGHFDHFLAAEEIREKTGAEIICSEKEEELLLDPRKNLSETLVFKPVTLKADRFVKEGDVLQFGEMKLQVLESPGHTKGGVCYYEEEEKVLFSGDTIFYHSIGRTDYPTGDFRDLVKSIKRKVLLLPEDISVLSGHGDFTTIGCEKAYFRV